MEVGAPVTFLSPLFLWALPLGFIPLVLHFLFKKKPKKMVFSHIEWLKQAHQSFMPRKRLREILLLVLRSLLFFFLILFFTRPVFHGGSPFKSKSDESTLVVLMDVSASMGAVSAGRSALEMAQDEFKAVLRALPPSTRVGLVSTSNQIDKEWAPTTDRAKLISAVDELTVLPRGTDILPALKSGMSLLANAPRGRRSLLILSDNARHGWLKGLEAGGRWDGYDPDVDVLVSEVVEKVPNVGIAEASLQPGEEGTLKGQFVVRRHSSAGAANVWRLEMNGRVIEQGQLSSTGNETETVPLEARLPEGGVYSGKVSLTADALPFDDVMYVAGRMSKGFRLLIVDGEGGLAPSDSETYYLKSALESRRDPRLQSIQVIRPESLPMVSLDQFDVIVLANTLGPIETQEKLLKWIEGGGGLFLTAGGKWAGAPSSPFGLFHFKKSVVSSQSLEAPGLGSPDSKKSFLSDVTGLDEFEWSEARVSQYAPLEPDSSTEVLLKLKNGSPLLFLKRYGKGTVLCLSTTVDRDWSNFPTKPLFAPLMRELLSRLADPSREESSLNGFVGEPIRVRLAPGVQRLSVVSPDGSVSGGRVDEDGLMEGPTPSVPGLYRIRTERKESDLFVAVHIKDAGREGDLTRVTEGELKTIFPRSSVTVMSVQRNTPERILSALQGWDLTKVLLVLLILFFLVETALSWTFERWRAVRGAAVLLLLCPLFPSPSVGGTANAFVYTQLKYDGAWDPYPSVHEKIFEMLQSMTNIPLVADRKVVTLRDSALFESPFLIVKGNAVLPFSGEEKNRLKQFIERGGFVFFDDTLADKNGPFGQSVRKLMSELFPDKTFQKLPLDHPIFRSFFLLRNVGGRRISENTLEGLDIGGRGGEARTAVIYCPNDLLGAWMRDQLGQYTFVCEPGGEPQRWDSFKLTVNVIYFSLTGTYKRDAIHQPFIERKLGY